MPERRNGPIGKPEVRVRGVRAHALVPLALVALAVVWPGPRGRGYVPVTLPILPCSRSQTVAQPHLDGGAIAAQGGHHTSRGAARLRVETGRHPVPARTGLDAPDRCGTPYEVAAAPKGTRRPGTFPETRRERRL